MQVLYSEFPSGLKVSLGLGLKYVNPPSDIQHWEYCIPGNKAYGMFGNGSGQYFDGYFIEYTDANGVVWKSQIGGHPAAESFKVTARGDNLGGFYYFNYSGTFNCTLYDGLGNIKVLSAGRFFSPTPSG